MPYPQVPETCLSNSGRESFQVKEISCNRWVPNTNTLELRKSPILKEEKQSTLNGEENLEQNP